MGLTNHVTNLSKKTKLGHLLASNLPRAFTKSMDKS